MKKKKIKFILLRHCETDWNKQHRWQGDTDNSLNDYGRKQAKDVIGLLKEYNLDCAVSSDLVRAIETANI
ncbi:MAG: histidine phosphatase family protein, partial [Patescibacteria group bacterium]|nr:histidine phosphatase family protein [Patescibacteria group bacterium]